MQAAQEMQRNNPELFESMQRQAAQFTAGGGAQPQAPQQQQGPTDSSTSDRKSSEQDKKQWKIILSYSL